MPTLKLPFWLSGQELIKLKDAAGEWFQKIHGWANWPLQQLDSETCDIGILNLIAWQRGIDRFTNEPENLYRRRVKYAYANARDAGSVEGFKKIFERLGLGYVEIEERQPDQDWDIIVLRVTDNTIAQDPQLLTFIIQTYGRTCRRYKWSVLTEQTISMKYGEFNWDQATYGIQG